jgi:hypothetical protein
MLPEIVETETSSRCALIPFVREALRLALQDKSEIDPDVLPMEGMSGRRYRHFINNLIGIMPDARYLEVGSWAGSTLCSAISNNAVRATAIDNWSLFGGPKAQFEANLRRFRTGRAYVNFIEDDFRKVDYEGIGPFNVYLFDGPHDAKDQYDGLMIAQPALDNEFVFIVDDWNWVQVREGTLLAIRQLGLSIVFSAEVRTTRDNSQPAMQRQNSDWHNGYFIAVLSRKDRRSAATNAEAGESVMRGDDIVLPAHVTMRQLKTSWGTVLCTDSDGEALWHVKQDVDPRNVFLTMTEGSAYLLYIGRDGRRRTICPIPTHRLPASLEGAMESLAFQVIPYADDSVSGFGLNMAGLYLCAEQDSRVTLSRHSLGLWERFEMVAADGN